MVSLLPSAFSSSFLLHTYLATLFPDHEQGIEGEKACIAQRGADSFLLSFGVVGRVIFDLYLFAKAIFSL